MTHTSDSSQVKVVKLQNRRNSLTREVLEANEIARVAQVEIVMVDRELKKYRQLAYEERISNDEQQ